jgi:hypothetical protein
LSAQEVNLGRLESELAQKAGHLPAMIGLVLQRVDHMAAASLCLPVALSQRSVTNQPGGAIPPSRFLRRGRTGVNR